MSFIVVGTNYKHSGIELREKIAFSKKRIKQALNFLKERGILKEAVIVSTCNRVEIYAAAEHLGQAEKEIIEFISCYHEINKNKFTSYLYTYKDEGALKHLFQVTAGLDSQVIRETQILSQIKVSFQEARKANFSGKFLTAIFNSAMALTKEIDRGSRIGEEKNSIGSVAIDFIKRKSGGLVNKNVLIIGVGKVTELVLKYLNEEKPNVVFISGRNYLKSKKLASRIGAKAVMFNGLRQCLFQADIIISATSSSHFIIRKETLGEVGNRKILIMDLALPRDVDPILGEIKNIDLFCLEDLNLGIEKDRGVKFTEINRIKKIIDIEADKQWKKFTRLEPEAALLP